ncbi:MAG: DEAD/DEAH box helicase [Odoribacter splanchnicus]
MKTHRVEEMIGHLRNYRHNRGIYEQLDKFVFEYPQEKSGDHLNRLRTGMAVEVIRTVREHSDDRLFYIEAPTGGGKTNLSMLAVTELMAVHPEIQKVFYVFPYTTLITQTNQTLKMLGGLHGTGGVAFKAGFNEKRRKERMDCMRIKSRIISIACLPFFLCALCRM